MSDIIVQGLGTDDQIVQGMGAGGLESVADAILVFAYQGTRTVFEKDSPFVVGFAVYDLLGTALGTPALLSRFVFRDIEGEDTEITPELNPNPETGQQLLTAVVTISAEGTFYLYCDYDTGTRVERSAPQRIVIE